MYRCSQKCHNRLNRESGDERVHAMSVLGVHFLQVTLLEKQSPKSEALQSRERAREQLRVVRIFIHIYIAVKHALFFSFSLLFSLSYADFRCAVATPWLEEEPLPSSWLAAAKDEPICSVVSVTIFSFSPNFCSRYLLFFVIFFVWLRLFFFQSATRWWLASCRRSLQPIT